MLGFGQLLSAQAQSTQQRHQPSEIMRGDRVEVALESIDMDTLLQAVRDALRGGTPAH